MTPAHRIELVLSHGVKPSLDQLPFRAGDLNDTLLTF
jgi:hypothetical protein